MQTFERESESVSLDSNFRVEFTIFWVVNILRAIAGIHCPRKILQLFSHSLLGSLSLATTLAVNQSLSNRQLVSRHTDVCQKLGLLNRLFRCVQRFFQCIRIVKLCVLHSYLRIVRDLKTCPTQLALKRLVNNVIHPSRKYVVQHSQPHRHV